MLYFPHFGCRRLPCVRAIVSAGLLVAILGQNVVKLFEIAQGEVCWNGILFRRYWTLFAAERGEGVVV